MAITTENCGTLCWALAHGYRTKILSDTVLLWQTNYQTAEYNVETGHITWHDREYFDTLTDT